MARGSGRIRSGIYSTRTIPRVNVMALPSETGRPDDPFHKLGLAWVFLCVALALHVADEALTGFLSVFNPTVAALRSNLPWLPLPQFEFGIWLAGLILAVCLLLVLSRSVFRGSRWIRPLAYFFAVIMVANAAGHTAGTIFGRTVESVHFARPMPGFYSSPALFVAAVYLLVQLRKSREIEPGT